jgi:hypothetical protein
LPSDIPSFQTHSPPPLFHHQTIKKKKNIQEIKKRNTSIGGAEGLQLEDQMSTRFRQPRFLWQTHVFQSSSSSKKKNIRITGEWTTMNIFGVNQVGEK